MSNVNNNVFSSLAFSVLPQDHKIVKILEITKTTAESKLTDISKMTKKTSDNYYYLDY